ncbi:RluA family pseudouridine synthase [Stieleria varia]|uniref:Ribosomal large subunit pseudouridine synthase A n=1 Tax=Stieleria varia TaxID=2528005 RepID=A0A5C6A362_9BACT|nr:RluA family pseudouridine synthase [Stieleria varia]TWT93805.1 Ribosomal large subunit pseudouridine synthase A [Stieleria varia]
MNRGNHTTQLAGEAVLYEDNHLLVINKPAGVATMGAETGEPTIHAMATAYLKHKYNKPGNVFVGIVSRLDAMTTGVLVLARTSKAASRLSTQFAGGGHPSDASKNRKRKASDAAQKLYLAIVQGDWSDSGLSDSGTLVDMVWKDDAAHRMRVARAKRTDTQRAEMKYAVLGRMADRTMLAIRLVTGRKHQIRLQLADRGHPIIGDRKYGADVAFKLGVALHSWQLLITHPTRATPLRFVAPLPDFWGNLAGIAGEADAQQTIAQALDWTTDTPVTQNST